jgi:MFS family permease
LWFFSQVLSASGTMTQGVALAWLMLRLTGSGVDLGLLTTCSFLPMLVAGPWSGNLIDRSNRRRLLIVTQSLFITLSTLLAVVIALGAVRVWMLFLFAFASGVVGTPDSAARQVYAIDLVGTDHLTSAISLNGGRIECVARGRTGSRWSSLSHRGRLGLLFRQRGIVRARPHRSAHAA